MNIRQAYTPNADERKQGQSPSFLILHYTATKTGEEAERRFLTNPDAAVSAHYMVDCDGAVTQFVDEKRRAWHAGVSYWDGETDLNSCSIGVEIVNPGHEFGYEDFSEKQMRAVITLCKDILSRYDIPPHHVLAHSDIAPDRKIDPGERFDWQRLAKEGVGLWPAPVRKDFTKAARLVAADDALRRALADYGYDGRLGLDVLLGQFQRHYHPEIYQTPDRAGRADRESAARLCALLRVKNAPKA